MLFENNVSVWCPARIGLTAQSFERGSCCLLHKAAQRYQITLSDVTVRLKLQPVVRQPPTACFQCRLQLAINIDEGLSRVGKYVNVVTEERKWNKEAIQVETEPIKSTRSQINNQTLKQTTQT